MLCVWLAERVPIQYSVFIAFDPVIKRAIGRKCYSRLNEIISQRRRILGSACFRSFYGARVKGRERGNTYNCMPEKV